MKISQKIRAIRKAEGLTQIKFCELLQLPLSTLKNYEGDHSNPALSTILQITNHPRFEKYTLWLLNDKTAPEAGQIAPALAHSGQDNGNSSHYAEKIG